MPHNYAVVVYKQVNYIRNSVAAVKWFKHNTFPDTFAGSMDAEESAERVRRDGTLAMVNRERIT